MTRKETVCAAISFGWKRWGELRSYGSSAYQCFRRKNEYIWIGLAFIDRSTRGVMVNFKYDGKAAIDEILA